MNRGPIDNDGDEEFDLRARAEQVRQSRPEDDAGSLALRAEERREAIVRRRTFVFAAQFPGAAIDRTRQARPVKCVASSNFETEIRVPRYP